LAANIVERVIKRPDSKRMRISSSSSSSGSDFWGSGADWCAV